MAEEKYIWLIHYDKQISPVGVYSTREKAIAARKSFIDKAKFISDAKTKCGIIDLRSSDEDRDNMFTISKLNMDWP